MTSNTAAQLAILADALTEIVDLAGGSQKLVAPPVELLPMMTVEARDSSVLDRPSPRRPRPNSRVTSRQIDYQSRNPPELSPEPLESTACDPCVMDRVFRISMPEIVLDQPKIVASVGEIEAAGMA